MGKPRKKMRREKPEFEQRLLDLRRVTRVVKGGRRFRFRATVVIGDRRGRVGVGVAKGGDVSDAISKAYAGAKKEMVTVPIVEGTIPHDVSVKLGSAKVFLKPAQEGRGLIAGGAVRAIVDMAGIQDITSKSLGTSNKLNVARATLKALSQLKTTDSSGKKLGRSAKQEVKQSAKEESLQQEEKKTQKESIQKKQTAPKKETKKKEVKNQ